MTRHSARSNSIRMSKIKSSNTSLDRAMQKLLVASNMPFVTYPGLYGRPDFLIGTKVALFCDSSFWHGRNWSKLKKQLENGSDPSYWVRHIAKNRARDRLVTRKLKEEGYRVVRFWDIEIGKNPDRCIATLIKELQDSSIH